MNILSRKEKCLLHHKIHCNLKKIVCVCLKNIDQEYVPLPDVCNKTKAKNYKNFNELVWM